MDESGHLYPCLTCYILAQWALLIPCQFDIPFATDQIVGSVVLAVMALVFHVLNEPESSAARRIIRWLWNRLMRIPPKLEFAGWIGLLVTGIGIEASTGEYLLGLIFLCASGASLALLSTRIEMKSQAAKRVVSSAVLGFSILLLFLSFKWTYEMKGNNPWSHLLPRHDYMATIFVDYRIPRDDKREIILYARKDEKDSFVTPVPVILFIRISNLQSIPTRIVDLRLSLMDCDGNEVALAEVPSDFLFHKRPKGERLSLMSPFLSEILKRNAIGAMDSADGVMMFDTQSTFSAGPYSWKISLKDISGRKQYVKVASGAAGENLTMDALGLKTMDEKYWFDPSNWKIAAFGEVVK